MTTSDHERIVAIRLGALGDMIMFLPALEALSKRFGQPVDVVCHGPWGDIVLSRSAAFGHGFTVNTTQWRPAWLPTNHRQALRWMSQPPPRAVFVFEGVPKMEHLLKHRWLSDIPVVRGTSLRFGTSEHRIDRELRIANMEVPGLPAPVTTASTVPHLRVTEPELTATRQWLARIGVDQDQPIHLIQIGNRRTMGGRLRQRRNPKHWPEQRWVDLIRHMMERQPDAAVLLCGVPAEHELAAEVAAQCGHDNVRSIADQLPLSRLFGLCHIATSLVSLDTGPAHVAAACGCNCVVLFGATDPAVFTPRGRGTISAVAADDMFAIQVETVCREWDTVLDSTARNVGRKRTSFDPPTTG